MGESIPDELLVEVLVDGIRSIPDGTGWVLDGFPTTAAQAALLEKALTGNEVSAHAGVVKKKSSR